MNRAPRRMVLNFTVALLGIISNIPGACAEDWKKQGGFYDPASEKPPEERHFEESSRSTRKKVFRKYSQSKRQFEPFCNHLSKDGRQEEFTDFIKSVTDHAECDSCTDLFKTLAKACRPKGRKKKKDEKEPPILRQREPNLALVQATLKLFGSFSREKEHKNAHYAAALALADHLSDNEFSTKGARDYFDSLAKMLFSPFLPYRRELERQQLEAQQEEEEWRGGDIVQEASSQAKEDELTELFGD